MSKIYILYDGVNAVKNSKVHGGGTFTRWLTWEIKKIRDDIELTIIWPKGVKPVTEEEKNIFSSSKFSIIECDSVFDIKFDKDILIIPIYESFKENIKKLKICYPNLCIRTVIHGMRNVDLAIFDKYQIYYHSWYKKIIGVSLLSKLRQNHYKRKEIKSIKLACKYSDRIFTVSNNSLQLIIRYGNPKWIKYYHQASISVNNKCCEDSEICIDKYMLLVNSNRNEKNFIRALIAFCNYKKKNRDSLLKFYVLGSNKEFINRLHYVNEIDWDIVNKDVIFFGYVSTDELSRLYHQAYFILYVSRSEGYGLPILDAVETGKPVLAGRFSSIPEVLGAAAFYVDPFDTISIENGIKYLYNEKNNLYYKELVIERYKLIKLRQELDSKILVNDLIE